MKQVQPKKLFDEIFRELGNIFNAFFVEPNKKAGPPPIVDVQIEELQRLLKSDWPEKQIANVFYYIKKKGYLIRKKISGQDKYFLSNKGIEKVLKLRAKKKMTKKKGEYLVIIFDIPEKERHKRHILRGALRRLGFEKFQRSVWITQFDVLEEIKRVVEFYHLEPYVRFIIATKLGKEIEI